MDTAQAIELAGKTRVANEKFTSTEEEKKRQGQMDLLGSEQRSKMDLQRVSGSQDQEKLKLANQLALPETTAKIGQANALAGYYGAETKNIGVMSPVNAGYQTALTNAQNANVGKTQFETMRDKERNDMLTPDVLKQIIAKNNGIPGLFNSSVATPGVPKNDALAPMNNTVVPINNIAPTSDFTMPVPSFQSSAQDPLSASLNTTETGLGTMFNKIKKQFTYDPTLGE